MKRQVLFVGCEAPFHGEIREFLKSHGGEVWFASSTAMAISVLDDHPINSVVMCIHNLPDAALLKYLSDHYPDIRVVVSAGKEFDSIVKAFSKGRYSLLSSPMEMKKLKEML